MEAQRFYLASQTVELSENKLYLELQNRICYYGEPNLNDVVLPIDGAFEKAQSLIDMPVVAKYRVNGDGKPDLGGHEAYVDPISGEIKFGTECVGTHVSVEIKDDFVEVNGEQKVLPCLFATARIWKRNKNMIEAIKRLFSEGNLYTSWEISVFAYEYDNGTKILSDYLFEGNCLLGEGVLPAYGKTSVVLDVASKKESELLVAEALAKDIVASDSEEETMEDEKRIEEVEVLEDNTKNDAEVVEEEKPTEEESSELPSDTSEDANEESAEEAEVAEDNEEESTDEAQEESSEESESEVDYKSELEKATEEIARLTEALTQAAEKYALLAEDMKQLKEYKDLYDAAQAEKEAKEKEEKIRTLSEKALKSKMISEDELQNDETIKKMISELDEVGIKAIIATRYMESLEKESANVEVSQKLPKRNLEEEAEDDGRSFYRAYLSK